jgi:hypothetical protein
MESMERGRIEVDLTVYLSPYFLSISPSRKSDEGEKRRRYEIRFEKVIN